MYKSNIINFVNRNEIIDNLDEMNKLKKAGIYFITDLKGIIDSISSSNNGLFHSNSSEGNRKAVPRLNPLESYLFKYEFNPIIERDLNIKLSDTDNSIKTATNIDTALYFDQNTSYFYEPGIIQLNKTTYEEPSSDVDGEYTADAIIDESSIKTGTVYVTMGNSIFMQNELMRKFLSNNKYPNGYHQMNNNIYNNIRNGKTDDLTGYTFQKNNGFPSLLFGDDFSSSFRLGENLKFQGFIDYYTDARQKGLNETGKEIMKLRTNVSNIFMDSNLSVKYLNNGKWIPNRFIYDKFSKMGRKHTGYDKIPRFMNFPAYNYYPVTYNESPLTPLLDGRYLKENQIVLSNPKMETDTYKYFNNDMNYVHPDFAITFGGKENELYKEFPDLNGDLNSGTIRKKSEGKTLNLRFSNDGYQGDDLFSKLGILEVIVTDSVVIQKYTNREYNMVRYFYEGKWTNWKSNLPMVTTDNDVNYPIGFGSHRNNGHTHAMKGKLYTVKDILEIINLSKRLKDLREVPKLINDYWKDKVKKEEINNLFIKSGRDEDISFLSFKGNNLAGINRRLGNREDNNYPSRTDDLILLRHPKDSKFIFSSNYNTRFRGFSTNVINEDAIRKSSSVEDSEYNYFSKKPDELFGIDFRFTEPYDNDDNFTFEEENNLVFTRFGVPNISKDSNYNIITTYVPYKNYRNSLYRSEKLNFTPNDSDDEKNDIIKPTFYNGHSDTNKESLLNQSFYIGNSFTIKPYKRFTTPTKDWFASHFGRYLPIKDTGNLNKNIVFTKWDWSNHKNITPDTFALVTVSAFKGSYTFKVDLKDYNNYHKTLYIRRCVEEARVDKNDPHFIWEISEIPQMGNGWFKFTLALGIGKWNSTDSSPYNQTIYYYQGFNNNSYYEMRYYRDSVFAVSTYSVDPHGSGDIDLLSQWTGDDEHPCFKITDISFYYCTDSQRPVSSGEVSPVETVPVPQSFKNNSSSISNFFYNLRNKSLEETNYYR